VLRHFTTPPHAQLRYVHLECSGLTAQLVVELACLPRLSHLLARKWLTGWSIIVPEVEKAHSRMRQQLLSRGAAGSADWHSPIVLRENCVDDGYQPPLGPHQQQDMRQRVLDDAAGSECWKCNLLASVGGADADTVRAVFFSELRYVLSTTVSWATGRTGREATAVSLCRQ
jgi:hypothetical protein